jgi:RHS repeat-associated protein
MEWQNGRQLSRATTERDSTTEDVLDFAYDANGIRTSKTVTRNTYRPVQTYKVTFVADGKTVKTMNVTEGYTLKDSDYPAVPEKAGYTGAWQRYPSPVKSNVTVSATYTKITTYYTVTFVADGFTVKTMQVYSGYILKDSDYPSVPEKLGYEGTWQKHTTAVMGNVTVQATYRKMLPLQVQFYAEETLLKSMQVEYGYRLVDSDYPDIPEKPGYRSWWSKHSDRIIAPLDIYASYEDSMGIIDPVKPSTVDSEPTEEPWEPIEPNAAPTEEPDIEEQDLSQSDWTLASTETVTHEYLTQSGKAVRETITTSMDTTTLDFFYDESGRPFAFNYTPEGSTPNTYYYILNLQGDVVQIIDEGGVLQAEYVYSPWGEVISAEGDLAEVNPLRYRGYYYDSETGFYYLQSRYYDPENHRFINADSYASTDSSDAIACNMFAYCGNNPVLNLDPTGEWSWKGFLAGMETTC